jgi:hypothetical protein
MGFFAVFVRLSSDYFKPYPGGGAERFTVNLSGANRSHWSLPVAFNFKDPRLISVTDKFA